MSVKDPHPPDETPEELREVLRRNHPELSDDELDRLLTGEPKRRRQPPPLIENRGKRESRYEAPSSGRHTSGQLAEDGTR